MKNYRFSHNVSQVSLSTFRTLRSGLWNQKVHFQSHKAEFPLEFLLLVPNLAFP